MGYRVGYRVGYGRAMDGLWTGYGMGYGVGYGASPPRRIWPLGDPFGVFPHRVVFAEEEQRAVDGEAVLPDGDGVVQSHSPGSLRFGLLEGSRGPSLRSSGSLPAAVLLGAPIPGAQPASHRLPEASHPARKRTGEPSGTADAEIGRASCRERV